MDGLTDLAVAMAVYWTARFGSAPTPKLAAA